MKLNHNIVCEFRPILRASSTLSNRLVKKTVEVPIRGSLVRLQYKSTSPFLPFLSFLVTRTASSFSSFSSPFFLPIVLFCFLSRIVSLFLSLSHRQVSHSSFSLPFFLSTTRRSLFSPPSISFLSYLIPFWIFLASLILGHQSLYALSRFSSLVRGFTLLAFLSS